VANGRGYHRNFLPHLTWSQFTSYTEEMPTMKAWRQLAEQGQLSGPPARYFNRMIEYLPQRKFPPPQ